MTDAADWGRVDDYIVGALVPADPALAAAMAANAAAKLPAIDVAPNQGKLLHIFAPDGRGAADPRDRHARWLFDDLAGAGAGAGGRLVTLEADPRHAEVARANIARAGLDAVVEIHVGPALATLPNLPADAPFDLVFIDADKGNNPGYLEWALKLTRPGSVIICDNVVRDGRVADAASRDSAIVGIRRFFEMLAAEPRLTGTAVQTVGSKGWDGFAIAIVA